ncbi:MAG: hypothetical protein ORN51_12045 [Akkermansiaceae bacterium]|nr:hypothetical protein [Akkermansiaceae bacterium]
MTAKPKPKPPSLAALARSSGISRETLRTWQAQGINIHSPDELLARIEGKKGKSTGKLAELKEEKLKLECQRLQTIILREEELLVPTEDILAVAKLVGMTTRLIFREMAGAVINQLDGRTQSEMFRILRKEVDERLMQISEMDYMPDSPLAKRLERKIASYAKQFPAPN